MSRSAEQRALISQVDAIKRAERKDAKARRPARVQPTAVGQRRPRVHDNGFLAFTRRLPCCVGPVGCEGAVEAAHIRDGHQGGPIGLGIKPDDCFVTPLCHAHHNGGDKRAQHKRGEAAWWRTHGLDPFAIAAGNFADYRKGAA